MLSILFLCFGGFLLYYLLTRTAKEKSDTLDSVLITEIDEPFLEKEVLFYSSLNSGQKLVFRKEVARFLSKVLITGMDTVVTEEDRILIAASAVIPIFHFSQWEDYPLSEVMLYSGAINLEFETNSHDSNILGMVGTGQMEGKMALSRHALREGFQNKTDKHNTAIHEFIHLIDKADGVIDGVPKILMDKTYALPWLRLIRYKIEEIKKGRSDIHEYGATNLSEFLAVSGEYFFERPDLLKQKHPELYDLLNQMFTGKISS
jgi:hypothetical protein